MFHSKLSRFALISALVFSLLASSSGILYALNSGTTDSGYPKAELGEFREQNEQDSGTKNLSRPLPLTLPDGSVKKTISENEGITISGPLHDPDGDSLNYWWKADGGRFDAVDKDKLNSVIWHPPAPLIRGEAFHIYVLVQDGRGLSRPNNFEIRVLKNSSSPPPVDPPAPSGGVPRVIGNIVPEIQQFPQVQLSFRLEGGENLAARDFVILEEGKQNTSPLVVLPPGPVKSKTNLYLFIDTSKRAHRSEEIIRQNVRGLIEYIHQSGGDVQVKLYPFSGRDRETDAPNPADFFAGDTELYQKLESLSSDTEQSGRASLLTQLNRAAREAADDANTENILLVINASPFRMAENGTYASSGTNYSLSGTLNLLSQKNFTVFTLGYPLKQIRRLPSANTRGAGLADTLPGGYLGSFSSDLTYLWKWVKERSSGDYHLFYFSSLPDPESARGKSAALGYTGEISSRSGGFLGTALGLFSYDPPAAQIPQIGVPELKKAEEGKTEVSVRIGNNHVFIGGASLSFADRGGTYRTYVMLHKRAESDPENSVYAAYLPEEILPADPAFSVKVWSPLYGLTEGNGSADMEDLAYDRSILLKAQKSIESGATKILWTWSGATVEAGTGFKFYTGNNPIPEIKDKNARSHFTEVNDCTAWQTARLEAVLADGKVRSSAPLGFWTGENIPSVTEEKSITAMIHCLKEKEVSALSGLMGRIAGDYQAGSGITLTKALQYLTAAMGSEAPPGPDWYAAIYRALGFISEEEGNRYQDGTVKIPLELLYKLIAETNHTGDFKAAYEKALGKVTARAGGAAEAGNLP